MKPGFPDRLTAAETELAAHLWDLGRDTHQIAIGLRVKESAVYRALAHRRDQEWLKRRAYKLLGIPA